MQRPVTIAREPVKTGTKLAIYYETGPVYCSAMGASTHWSTRSWNLEKRVLRVSHKKWLKHTMKLTWHQNTLQFNATCCTYKKCMMVFYAHMRLKGPDSASRLSRTLVFEWYVLRYGYKNNHQKLCVFERDSTTLIDPCSVYNMPSWRVYTLKTLGHGS